MIYIRFLANSLSGRVMSPLSCLVTAYVAAAKRGTVSAAYINKVTAGMLTDLNVPVTLNASIITNVYNLFGSKINETNAKAIFQRWLDMLPMEAMRLKLTLDQVAGQGMTAFVTIGRAMRAFPDFYWHLMAKLLTTEMNHWFQAHTTVAGNMYYGFSLSLVALAIGCKNISSVKFNFGIFYVLCNKEYFQKKSE